jgi:hypothetical protein
VLPESLNRCIVAALLAVCLLSSSMAVTHGSSTPAAAATCEITTGIVTGVGAGGSGTCSEGLTHVAKCNGSTDDNKAFVNFNNWALNWQRTNSGLIELFIPSGVTCVYKQTSLAFAGVKQLLIYGYGATLTGPVHWLAGDGQRQNNMHSTRVQNYASSTGGQINARDTSVKVYPGSSSQPAACSTVARCVGLSPWANGRCSPASMLIPFRATAIRPALSFSIM